MPKVVVLFDCVNCMMRFEDIDDCLFHERCQHRDAMIDQAVEVHIRESDYLGTDYNDQIVENVSASVLASSASGAVDVDCNTDNDQQQGFDPEQVLSSFSSQDIKSQHFEMSGDVHACLNGVEGIGSSIQNLGINIDRHRVKRLRISKVMADGTRYDGPPGPASRKRQAAERGIIFSQKVPRSQVDHQNQSKGEQYPCTTCKIMFTTRGLRDSHHKKKHRPIPCRYCGQVQIGRHNMSTHIAQQHADMLAENTPSRMFRDFDPDDPHNKFKHDLSADGSLTEEPISYNCPSKLSDLDANEELIVQKVHAEP